MKQIKLYQIKLTSNHPKSINKLIKDYIFSIINYGITCKTFSDFSFDEFKLINKNKGTVLKDYEYLKNNSDIILDEISEVLTYHFSLKRDEILKAIKNKIK